jgi:hypothetical protein
MDWFVGLAGLAVFAFVGFAIDKIMRKEVPPKIMAFGKTIGGIALGLLGTVAFLYIWPLFEYGMYAVALLGSVVGLLALPFLLGYDFWRRSRM